MHHEQRFSKARKAGKAKAKQEAEERGNNQTAPNVSEELIAAHIQKLQLGNKCMHGVDPV